MPLFYFDVEDGKYLVDVEGSSLPDVRSAEAEALRVLVDIAANAVRESPGNDHTVPLAVTLRNDAGHAVYKVAMSITVDRRQVT